MALPDLKGLQIQETYQRVVHTDGTNYFNGSGSALPNLITGVTAGSNAFELKFTLGNGLEQTVTIPQVATSGTPPLGGYPELVYTDDLNSLVQGVTLSNGFFSNSLQLNVFKYNGGATTTTINIDPFPYEGNAEITGSLDVIGNTQIGGNLTISGSSSEIILISESAQNSNCKIYNSGDSLILYANVGLGKAISLANNMAILATSNQSYINGFFRFKTPPNDSKPQVTLERRNGATLPGLEITNTSAIGPAVRSDMGIEISGSSIFTGSLEVKGNFIAQLPTSSNETYFLTYNTASFELEAREVATLINPKVEYLDLTASISSGTSITLPNNLSYISSSTYEYLEVFFNGLRLRYDRDFIPTSTTTIQTQIAFPSGSELTFKSLKA